MRCVCSINAKEHFLVYDSDNDTIVEYDSRSLARELMNGNRIEGAKLCSDSDVVSSLHDYRKRFSNRGNLVINRVVPNNASSIKSGMLFGANIGVVGKTLFGISNNTMKVSIRVSSLCDKIAANAIWDLSNTLELIFDNKFVECEEQYYGYTRLRGHDIIINLREVSDIMRRTYYVNRFNYICKEFLL